MSFHPFSARRTRQALEAGTVTARDEMRYWLVSSLVGLFFFYHSAWVGLQANWFLLYDVLIAVAILWIGLHEAFKANGGEAGREFLRRVVLLGVPLGLVVLAASQALYWASWYVFPLVIDQQSFRDPAFAWQLVNFFLFNGIQIWFWWRLHAHISTLASTDHE